MNQDTNINCPVSKTLSHIGGKYKSLILWHLMENSARFSELQKRVPQATPKMLTQQLRELESDFLITRTVYPVVPPKVEYALTEKGKSLRPVLSAMFDWGMNIFEEEGIKANCSMMDVENGCGCNRNIG